MIQDVIWDHYWDYTAAPTLSEVSALNNPKGIQLRRTHGYRKPLGATVVSRLSRWGNPYRVGHDGVHDALLAVGLFEEAVVFD